MRVFLSPKEFPVSPQGEVGSGTYSRLIRGNEGNLRGYSPGGTPDVRRGTVGVPFASAAMYGCLARILYDVVACVDWLMICGTLRVYTRTGEEISRQW